MFFLEFFYLDNIEPYIVYLYFLIFYSKKALYVYYRECFRLLLLQFNQRFTFSLDMVESYYHFCFVFEKTYFSA